MSDAACGHGPPYIRPRVEDPGMRMNDTKGSMPFAVIAVALLMASVALGAVVNGYDRAGDGVGSVTNDIDALDEAVADITEYVNRGLGEVIMGLSTASDGDTVVTDTVEQRAELFRQKAGHWIEFQFPIRSGGAVAELVSYDVQLTAEPLLVSSEDGTGGYTPTYLKGTGTIDVVIRSSSGKATVTLDISTDGSYALPLTAERLSLFENMMKDGGISVSQMVSYQLTSLAQYRVLNGYGALAQYGEKGTDRIITADDVRRAYSNALEAISMICFRDEDNTLRGADSADLADLLADDGEIVLDLSAVYAQALAAAVDELALKWFDYFCGYEILDALDKVLNSFKNAVTSLVAFILGQEVSYSAVPYIEKVMELSGIDESDYRYPGAGTTTVSAAGITVTVQNPTYDVLSASWLDDFEKRYNADTNFVMEFIIDVVNSAAVRVASQTDLGSVSAKVDPYDSESYAETLARLFSESVENGLEAVEDAISKSLSDSEVYDPFYGAIADEISSHAGEMVLSDQLAASIRSAFASAIPEGSEVTVEDLESSGALDRALQSYRQRVYADLEVFDSLRQVEGSDSLIKRVLTEICAFGLRITGITNCVPSMAKAMCDDIVDMMEVNPHGGLVDLPGTTGFTLDDGSGNLMSETVSPEMVSTLVVESIYVNEEACVHTVGFREHSSAAYTTVITVELSDLLEVTLTGTGALAGAMGTYSSLIAGTVPLSTTIEVAVASGWALAGIQYNQSATFYDDLWNLLLELFEPLIEPLRQMMAALRNAVTTISEALMEALSYVAEQLMRIYQAIYEPLETLKEWIETSVESLFTNAVFGFLVEIAMNEQSVTFQFLGCTLEFSTKAITWVANTKTLLTATMTMPVAGLIFTASITAKVRGDLAAENLIITGTGGVEGDGWAVEMYLDPLMKGSTRLVAIDAEIGDTEISLVAPKLENYHEMGIALSDVPGLGDVISNIPLGGVKLGLDAGFSIKFSNPEQTGLIVNEFESNPAGDDSGNEWVELYNNSLLTIDLTGYTLKAASDRRTKTMALSGTISPGEFLIIYPDFTLVNTSGKYTKNGEAIVLVDPDGNEIDRTPTKKDTANDDYTWQRSFDGSTEWVFAKGTMGGSNASYPGASLISAADVKNIVWSAVEKSFDRVETISDLETLQSFLQYMVRYTLEGLIGHVAGQILEASVYVSVDVMDPTSSLSTGVRVALRTDGDLVEDVMKYVVGKVMEMVLNVSNPYKIDPVGMFTENIDLEVTFHTGIGFPKVLGSLADTADLPELDLGVTFRTNLAGITRIIGSDTGTPEVVFGVRIIDCPDVAIPSKMSARKNMEHDLWLMMVTVRFA